MGLENIKTTRYITIRYITIRYITTRYIMIRYIAAFYVIYLLDCNVLLLFKSVIKTVIKVFLAFENI